MAYDRQFHKTNKRCIMFGVYINYVFNVTILWESWVSTFFFIKAFTVAYSLYYTAWDLHMQIL